MLRSWLFYLSALIGVTVFHSYYTGWFSEYLFWFWLLLPVFSLLLSLPGMLRARLDCPKVSDLPRGQTVQVPVTLTGKTLFPITRCTVISELYDRTTGQLTSKRLRLHTGASVSVLLPSEHCAGIDWTLRRGRVYDFLGLFCLPLRSDCSSSFLVLPVPAKPSRLPDLTRFVSPRMTPKPGGGFSEQHELREYRPGDPLRQIHWKLTAKTDKLIVREPMQCENADIFLTFDLRLPQETLDRTLEALVWLSDWMLEQGLRHTVCWLDAESLCVRSRVIGAQEDRTPLLRELLSAPLSDTVPDISERSFPQAGLVYHVCGDATEEAET